MPELTTPLDLEDLRATIAEVIDVDIAEVTDTADFKETLDVDSLLALEILVTLERKYGVKLAESNLQKVRSLHETYALLAEQFEASS
ncbi:acyl carrier protein [Streptomyces sp. NPDC088816]|uniref:acyl carrier protein n=1 Tax=Streptomyces sp. NPDC088816 TaxID=3365906 RepID=UPI0038203D34